MLIDIDQPADQAGAGQRLTLISRVLAGLLPARPVVVFVFDRRASARADHIGPVLTHHVGAVSDPPGSRIAGRGAVASVSW